MLAMCVILSRGLRHAPVPVPLPPHPWLLAFGIPLLILPTLPSGLASLLPACGGAWLGHPPQEHQPSGVTVCFPLVLIVAPWDPTLVKSSPLRLAFCPPASSPLVSADRQSLCPLPEDTGT